ncbi:SUDS3 [Lepeophtheirus salmonis]|uniref:SUDS3 n=1 Tax=Lepeophtheirus salmonis TaxID=72036 RepID=A0A7R8CLC0_LEPSM|nr:SUDS3 [Lepeophtheirus salmonis]CAF2852724.1 SUDS3 [Lepeophtheirus salmonis]
MNVENNYESPWAEDSESQTSVEMADDEGPSESDLYPSHAGVEGQEQYVELMYQDKLSHLKRQLEKLEEGIHPEYVKKLRKLECSYKERMRVNDIVRDLEIEMVEQDYLVVELEDKQKFIENERHSMELTGDSMELKPISTRKLRRRTNEPSSTGLGSGSSDKRRKKHADEYSITSGRKHILETRIEDGKLFYEKKWFRRGQTVQVESFNGDKFSAVICNIGNEAIWVRKSSENTKIRIYLPQLAKGKYLLKRRAV